MAVFTLTIDTSTIPRNKREEVVAGMLGVARETVRVLGLVEDDRTHYSMIDGSDASQPLVNMQECEYGGRVVGSWSYVS